ncbi:UDP-N-acetylglucosamine-peptide N-acetylglucosaminyltransferase [Methylomonas methanica]|uniref:UDP-N-acetylglucosamine-peptide N-acetylglucosaminyltransferase n=1 Tax=Methylomonas methanica TaxID=421 RepID=A0A177MKA7_METMH|nr:UDP-N-acetylglucosamine-peptide N-acetylglucosaminyltransferase [Methylomonas methanica]OAI06032.1 UDP-N-acetylglucosamine-peptide N-acetylglucosaminyltransferase [Methylomonas methanica]
MKFYDRSRSLCEWERVEEWREKMRVSLAAQESNKVSPFHLLSIPGVSAAEQRLCADLWLKDRIDATAVERADLAFSYAASSRPKIRLGYLSCDFHEHATAFLLAELFEAHDREQFEVYAYSYGPDDGLGMRQRLCEFFDSFVDLQALSLSEAAQAIHQDNIDILIDLKGYTRGTRTEILSYRPAPIQVNYLGYPGTLGGDFCDYIITDPYLTPAASAADYSEAFAYLPDSYQPHGRHAEIGKPTKRSQHGLDEHSFVFCCFNQAYKITPDVFDIWCRLLYTVPGSVLWLLKNSKAKGRLRNEAYQRGIAPDRLIFADDLPQVEHLGRLVLADLVLDTQPYNAHTTASDALWVGVPIVTCVGDTFASRVAGSLLHAIGLPELIAADLEGYYDLALELATHPERLSEVRQKLADNRLSTPLFDIKAYTRNLEALYQTMWQRHVAGDLPIAIGQTEPRL